MSIPIQRWRATVKWHDFGARRIAWHEEGAGEPLLLIHGFPTCSWDWNRLWPHLSQDNRCIALDMLGFGLSDKPRPHRYSLFEQADLHEDLLAAVGMRDIHVIAHDYGDTVLQELLARQRDGRNKIRVLSAYMLNGGIIPGQHRPRLMQRLLHSPLGPLVARLITERGFRRSFSEIFGPDTSPTNEELAAWWEQITVNDGARIMHLLIRYMAERRENYERWVGVLAHSPAPLRFFTGECDPISGRHMADSFSKLGPNQNVGTLPRIGHYPQTEAPQVVLQDYAAFRASINIKSA